MSKKLIGLLGFTIINVYAADLQFQLMEIAAAEARIANIGANKVSMLYGTNNPIATINHWNMVAHRPSLTQEQINQINELEVQKQDLIKLKACQ